MSTSKPLRRSAFWWIATAIAVRNLNGLRQLHQTLAWVDQPAAGPSGEPLVLHVVVPVLREQQQIASALAWFVPLLRDLPGSTLTIVSTAREDYERRHTTTRLAGVTAADLTAERFPQLTDEELTALSEAAADGPLTASLAVEVLARFPSTADVIADEIARLPRSALRVRHVHYEGEGRKAAQVNAAVEGVAAGTREYVAIYDVDSRPSRELLYRTFDFLAHHRDRDRKSVV